MAFNGIETADRLVEPSFGLFSVAEVHERGASDERWVSGFFVESQACGEKVEGQPLCTAQDDTKYTIFDSSLGAMYFHVNPFDIINTFKCKNSIGFDAVDRRATVVDQLDRVSEYAVERELWVGTAAQVDSSSEPADRWLIGATDVTPTPGTAVRPRLALALVEQRFAEANPGVQAIIHVTPLMATILGADGAFDEIDGKLITPAGSILTISRGGDGDAGPAAGGTATRHWIYATGPVHVDLGAEELITVSQGEIVNASTNEVAYVASRPASVYFDGCSWFGALADATL